MQICFHQDIRIWAPTDCSDFQFCLNFFFSYSQSIALMQHPEAFLRLYKDMKNLSRIIFFFLLKIKLKRI